MEPALSLTRCGALMRSCGATQTGLPMNARFSLGIDLGTSNSAIAVADLETDQTRIVEITQILGPNQLGETPTLASALYVPHREEFPQGSFRLPWQGCRGARNRRPVRARPWR